VERLAERLAERLVERLVERFLERLVERLAERFLERFLERLAEPPFFSFNILISAIFLSNMSSMDFLISSQFEKVILVLAVDISVTVVLSDISYII
jgi:hypothetical protein